MTTQSGGKPRWVPTPKQAEVIRRMASEGHGYYAILNAINARSWRSLARWATDNGVEITSAEAHRKWSPEDGVLLVHLARSGATFEEIRAAFPYRTERALRIQLHLRGLTKAKTAADYRKYAKRWQPVEPIFGGLLGQDGFLVCRPVGNRIWCLTPLVGHKGPVLLRLTTLAVVFRGHLVPHHTHLFGS